MHANRVICTVHFGTYSISVSCYSSSLCINHSSPQRRCPAFESLGRQIISSLWPFWKASSSDANLFCVQKGHAETKVRSLGTRLTKTVRVQEAHHHRIHPATYHALDHRISRLFLRDTFTQHRHRISIRLESIVLAVSFCVTHLHAIAIQATSCTQHRNNCMLRILTSNLPLPLRHIAKSHHQHHGLLRQV